MPSLANKSQNRGVPEATNTDPAKRHGDDTIFKGVCPVILLNELAAEVKYKISTENVFHIFAGKPAATAVNAEMN